MWVDRVFSVQGSNATGIRAGLMQSDSWATNLSATGESPGDFGLEIKALNQNRRQVPKRQHPLITWCLSPVADVSHCGSCCVNIGPVQRAGFMTLKPVWWLVLCRGLTLGFSRNLTVKQVWKNHLSRAVKTWLRLLFPLHKQLQF